MAMKNTFNKDNSIIFPSLILSNGQSPFNEKSKYFLELEKRKIKHKNKLDIIKTNQIYDDIILKEKNYSYFAQGHYPKVQLPRLFVPGLRVKLLTNDEKVNYYKYQKQRLKGDDFANIYLTKRNNKVEHNSSSNLNKNFYLSYKNNLSHKKRYDISPENKQIHIKDYITTNNFNDI